MQNKVHLIAYADRLGGDLQELNRTMENSFGSAIAGVHILPFYTPFDGADAGFDPVDHTQVDPRLGDWVSLAALGARYDVMADVIVNHMSSDSPEFVDYCEHGEASSHASLFLTFADVFADGAKEEELTAIYRPRPGFPFTSYSIGGKRRLVWTTFTPQQIDINVQDPAGEAYIDTILKRLAAAGVTSIRLDAVGYAVKKAGTSCFMTRETMEYIGRLTDRARGLGLEVLVEVHSYYERQIEIARQVDWVYDFALPPLVLHALYSGDSKPLLHWWRVRPQNAITVLDTHDGIGVIDVGADPEDPSAPGLLTDRQIGELVNHIHAHSCGQSREATGAAASNLDLYQVNCTFYAALGEDDDKYLLARALQFFTPGVPQVYYVGALAGGNDMDLLTRSGVGRDINRHYYTKEEVAADLERPVVKALLALMHLRSSHSAFLGEFHVSSDDTDSLRLRWESSEGWIELDADLRRGSGHLAWTRGGETGSAALLDLRTQNL